MPGLSATVEEQIAALTAVAGPAVVARIQREPDNTIAGIVSGWPQNFDAKSRDRRSASSAAEKTFEDIIRIHIEDELRRHVRTLANMATSGQVMALDIIAIGEPLIEFNQTGGAGSNQYLQGFGGDSSNFIIAAARQGARSWLHHGTRRRHLRQDVPRSLAGGRCGYQRRQDRSARRRRR